ncbi:MAG: T9SS type A sorting domain-containing protein [Saprospiraceae bacterium]
MKKKLMTVKYLWISVFCLFMNHTLLAQNFFQKTFGDSTITEQGKLVHQTPDGTIYYFGYSLEGITNTVEITMHKLTSNGDIISKTVFSDDNGSEYALSMVYNNGVFIIVGEQHIIGTTNIDGLIMMVDTLGQILNYQIIGESTRTESYHGITKSNDGGYIVCGFVSGASGSGNDFLTVKFNVDLTIAWSSIEGTVLNETGMKSIELPNGNIITTGDQQQFLGNYNVYCQIFDAGGNFLYSKTIVEPYNGGSKTAMLDSNNDILILGEMSTPTSFNFDAYLIKLDKNVNTIWTKYLTNNSGGDAGFSIIEPNAGDYVICGYGENPVTNDQDLMLLSTDTSGNVIERKYYGNSSPDIAYMVYPSVNGGFLLSGSVHVGVDAQYFLIYDELEVAVSTQESKVFEENFTIFPNPLTQKLLQFSQPIEQTTLSIFNQNGQLVERQKIEKRTTEYTIQSTLSSGNYFIHFEFENHTKTVQIIVP